VTFDPKASPEQRLQAIAKLCKQLRSDDAPILVGPFRSELGFEASYFQPFIAYLAKQVPDFATRAAIVTRGGLASLYQPHIPRGVDLFSLRSVTDVRRENLYDQRTTGLLKQVRQTDFDTAVLKDAARSLGLGPVYHTIHPVWMYWGLAPYWEEVAGVRHLQAVTDYAPLTKPAKWPGSEKLPTQYVAMKFYRRATFPYPDAETEPFVSRLAGTIAAQIPVVLLPTSSDYDDHSDLPIQGENILAINGNLPAHENLLVTASILAHAKAFVGTYGGMAQFALRLGVPSVSVWKEFGGTSHAHLSLQSWISKATKVPFTAGSLTDASLWQGVLAVPQMPTVTLLSGVQPPIDVAREDVVEAVKYA
jgi:hypothetical protein